MNRPHARNALHPAAHFEQGWAVRHVYERACSLAAGDGVLTGSLFRSQVVQSGDRVDCKFPGLGGPRCHFSLA